MTLIQKKLAILACAAGLALGVAESTAAADKCHDDANLSLDELEGCLKALIEQPARTGNKTAGQESFAESAAPVPYSLSAPPPQLGSPDEQLRREKERAVQRFNDEQRLELDQQLRDFLVPR